MANGDDDKTVTFSVSMPVSTLELLDKYLEHLKSEHPEFQISRGSVLTGAFTEFIKQWAIKNLPEYRNKSILKRAYIFLAGES